MYCERCAQEIGQMSPPASRGGPKSPTSPAATAKKAVVATPGAAKKLKGTTPGKKPGPAAKNRAAAPYVLPHEPSTLPASPALLEAPRSPSLAFNSQQESIRRLMEPKTQPEGGLIRRHRGSAQRIPQSPVALQESSHVPAESRHVPSAEMRPAVLQSPSVRSVASSASRQSLQAGLRGPTASATPAGNKEDSQPVQRRQQTTLRQGNSKRGSEIGKGMLDGLRKPIARASAARLAREDCFSEDEDKESDWTISAVSSYQEPGKKSAMEQKASPAQASGLQKAASESQLPAALSQLRIIRSGSPMAEPSGRSPPSPMVQMWESALSRRAMLNTKGGGTLPSPGADDEEQETRWRLQNAGLSKGVQRDMRRESLVGAVVFGQPKKPVKEQRRTRPGSVDPGLRGILSESEEGGRTRPVSVDRGLGRSVSCDGGRTRPGSVDRGLGRRVSCDDFRSHGGSAAGSLYAEDDVNYAGLPCGYCVGEGRRHLWPTRHGGQYQAALSRSCSESMLSLAEPPASPAVRPPRKLVPGLSQREGFSSQVGEIFGRGSPEAASGSPEAAQFFGDSAGRPTWKGSPRCKRPAPPASPGAAGLAGVGSGRVFGLAGGSAASEPPCTPRSDADFCPESPLRRRGLRLISEPEIRGPGAPAFHVSQAAHDSKYDSDAEEGMRATKRFAECAGVATWQKRDGGKRLLAEHAKLQQEVPNNALLQDTRVRAEGLGQGSEDQGLSASESQQGVPPSSPICYDRSAGEKSWVERAKCESLHTRRFRDKPDKVGTCIHGASSEEAASDPWPRKERSLKKQFPSAPVRQACVDTMVFNQVPTTARVPSSAPARNMTRVPGQTPRLQYDTPRCRQFEDYYEMFGESAGNRTWYRPLEAGRQGLGVKRIEGQSAAFKPEIGTLLTPRPVEKPRPPPRPQLEEGGGAPWDRMISSTQHLFRRQAQATSEETPAGVQSGGSQKAGKPDSWPEAGYKRGKAGPKEPAGPDPAGRVRDTASKDSLTLSWS
eukprot:TRINITY_DN7413_c0_g1_i3.p1 TRINITY_DN7413_c0_g1~~TRINITY_DN7413_c0_g1_i3.p1  ORF type:complete len:1004 (-),score=176.81 TRINITY_DN7413_c0_g1_i3:39-3050(-)